MKPSLPQTIAHDIQCVKAATWNQLLRCVAWAMDHPKPDGATIFSNGDGVVSARPARAGAAPAAGGDGTRVPVYNYTYSVIPKGAPVQFISTQSTTSVRPYYDANKAFLVAAEDIPVNGRGVAIVAGVAEIAVVSGSGDFAVPGANGFSLAAKGIPVLSKVASGSGYVYSILMNVMTTQPQEDRNVTNFAYVEGSDIVVTWGRVGIAGSYEKRFDEERIPLSSVPAGGTLRIYFWVGLNGPQNVVIGRSYMEWAGRNPQMPENVKAHATLADITEKNGIYTVTRAWLGGDYVFNNIWI